MDTIPTSDSIKRFGRESGYDWNVNHKSCPFFSYFHFIRFVTDSYIFSTFIDVTYSVDLPLPHPLLIEIEYCRVVIFLQVGFPYVYVVWEHIFEDTFEYTHLVWGWLHRILWLILDYHYYIIINFIFYFMVYLLQWNLSNEPFYFLFYVTDKSGQNINNININYRTISILFCMSTICKIVQKCSF